MADLKAVSLLDLLSPSIRNDTQMQAAAKALDWELKAVTEAIKKTLLLSRLDELPESIIDLLAWQFHVDFYEADLMIEQKRELVKTSIEAHRRKGTPYAVELVVSTILDEAEVQEWFDYGGDPYYFRVVKVGGSSFDAESYQQLIRAISTVKNTRSWLDKISISRERSGNLYFGSMGSVGTKLKIKPLLKYQSNINSSLYYGKAIHIASKITIQPNTFKLTIGSQNTYLGPAMHSAQKTTIYIRKPNVGLDNSLSYFGFAARISKKITIKTEV